MNNSNQKYFKEKILDIKKLNHSGNNILFKVNTLNKKYLLKKYSILQKDNWNRGKSEFFALNYLWKKGFREIPQPFNLYLQDQIGVYSFEGGITLDSSEVKKIDILAIADFLAKIHNLRIKDKFKFKLARTSCLNISSYINLIESRYKNLMEDFIGDEHSRLFMCQKVYPKINELKKKIIKSVSPEELSRSISLDEQVVTPGDFGFHNILVNKSKYTFIDFEYCGRDDPVKQILDFLHHEKSRGIGKELKDLFIKKYLNEASKSIKFEEKLKLLDPLIGMNWVLIYLNPFSKNYLEHMKFSRDIKKIEDILRERLAKAQLKFKNLSYFE